MIAEGCIPGMSFVRWMSMTSGRNFRLFPRAGMDCRTRLSASCNSLDKGATEGMSPSTSISSSEAPSSDPVLCDNLRFFRAGCAIACRAHSGAGLSDSNCLRRRFEYSRPLTTSSASVFRSFRNRGTVASETSIRSSSLSSHAGACRDRSASSSSSCTVASA